MGEDGARGKDWLRARGASLVSYRHNFLVIFIITRIAVNNNTPHLKSQKNKTKQKSRLGMASNKITGALLQACGRPTLALCSALVPQTLRCSVCVEDS